MNLPIVIEVRKHPHKNTASKFSEEARIQFFIESMESCASLWGLQINHMGPKESMVDFFIKERKKNKTSELENYELDFG